MDATVSDAGGADATLSDATPAPDGSGSDTGLPASLCDGGVHTTLSGRVYDPASANPLYGVVVYVPGATPGLFPSTPPCGSCAGYYTSPLASAVTDTNGNFRIVDPPSGASVPLVVQQGKWRMRYNTAVTQCQDNPLPDHSLRLPKNHVEGDMPQIAVSTGEADSLECAFLRMGIDASEYVGGAGTATGGHIHVFTSAGGAGGGASTLADAGASPNPATALWDKVSDITPYDAVLFSCEGVATASMNAAGQQVILTYANNGGRVFASHYHYAILSTGPFSSQGAPPVPLATWSTDMLYADTDPMYGRLVTTLPSGQPFPEGVAFSTWLGAVGALSSNGELQIHYSRDNAQVGSANTASQAWINSDINSVKPGSTQYFSFDTPLGGGNKCGRVVYSDIHASGGPNNSSDPGTDYPGFNPGIVPGGCSQHALTTQEKALEFMIFDLTSCLTPPGQVPQAP